MLLHAIWSSSALPPVSTDCRQCIRYTAGEEPWKRRAKLPCSSRQCRRVMRKWKRLSKCIIHMNCQRLLQCQFRQACRLIWNGSVKKRNEISTFKKEKKKKQKKKKACICNAVCV